MVRLRWGAGLLALCISGCGDEGVAPGLAGAPPKTFDFQGMLIQYADRIIEPSYQRARLASEGLAAEIATACDATEPSAPVAAAAWQNSQAAWSSFMLAWQDAELLWLGPLAENDLARRNRIYSYGTNEWADACAIDIQVATAGQPSRNSVRGLDTLEYLLFAENLNTRCSSAVPQLAGWNAKPDAERLTLRCQYARKVADALVTETRQLEAAWRTDGGDYRRRFINPDNLATHIKALSDAMFYLEKEVKDSKLGLPLALEPRCQLAACPQAVEFRHQGGHAAAIAQNLRQFHRVLTGNDSAGGEGLGFDDYLRHLGFESVVQAFDTDIRAALAFAEQLAQDEAAGEASGLAAEANRQLSLGQAGKTACLNAALNPDLTGAEALLAEGLGFCTLQGAIKRITDRLRTDFVLLVNVDLPQRAQSDAD